MQGAKEKISNMASVAKEKADIYKANVEEKVEKASASTHEEKKIAEERRKAKVAEAKMELHEAKARHAAQKLTRKQDHLGHHTHQEPVIGAPHVHHEPHVPGHHHHTPVGTGNPMAGATVPTYPVGQQYPATKYL